MALAQGAPLRPYLADLHASMLAEQDGPGWRAVDGTLIFADVSGFTPLTERLSRQGKIGAELLTGALTRVFTQLLRAAGAYGGDCLKFGGDALLLLFTGPDHAKRGIAGADAVRAALWDARRNRTDGLNLSGLNMSMGVHSGTVHAFLVGDTHKELVVTGPAVTRTLALEAQADAGEILLSAEAKRVLSAGMARATTDGAFRLIRPPSALRTAVDEAPARDTPDIALGLCEILRDYLPSAPEDGEHRLAAPAFLKFGGVDAVIAEHGPEELYRRLDALVGAVQRALVARGVTYLDTDVDKDGGKIWLTAGAPTTTGDDEDRVLDAVTGVLAEPHELLVRCGVNRGRVFALNLGSPWRRTYTVMGDTVNLAARVMGKAAWGQVLATTGVVDRTRTDFEVEPVQPFMVKGKSEPVSAAAVLSARGTREIAAPTRTRMVGREDELAVLDSAVESAFQGSGRVVAIVGPPGIGKTKLVAETIERAEGMLVVRIQGGRYSAATPHFALRRPLLAGLGLLFDTPPAEVEATLRATVQRRLPHLTDFVPLIAAALGITVADTERTAALNAEERRREAGRVLAELIAAMLTRPTLLVVEDGYWVDTASSEVLDALCRGSRAKPWAILVTRRETIGGFDPPELDNFVRVHLEPLPPRAALELARQELGGVALAPGVVDQLLERANGNPLFLRELVAAAAAGSLTEVPDTVEQTMAARIDTLPAADRVLLRHAAVLGGRFAEPWLAEMLDRSLAETRHDLARLRHFLEPDAPGMVRFQHILLRDVAYEGLPYRTRRDLHRRAGIVLERSAGDDPDALSGLLSIHFHHARQFQKSWHYSVEAGRRSTAQGAPVEAAQFFDRALMAASHLTVDPAARTAVAEELGDALAAAGRYTLSVGAYRRARGVRRSDAVVGARVARKLGRALDRNGDYPGAIRWYRRAIEELGADQSADAQAQRAQTMVTWASSRFRLGQQRQALPALFAAIRDAEDCGALSTLAEAYRLVDQAYHELGEFEKAVFSERALAISTQLGDPRGVALANENLAALDLECGRWDAAIARYGLAGDFYKSVGQMVEFASCVANVGEVHRDQGRLREAEELFLEARSIWSGAGWKFAIGWVHSCLGQVTARAGRWHEADEYFRAAAQVLQELAAQQTLVMLNVRRLEALLLQGEFEASRSREQAVRRDAERLGLRAAITSLDRLIAHADAATGHVDAAIARVLAALEQSRARGTRYETAQCLEALARFHALAGSTEAEPIGQQAKEAYAALGVIWTPIIPLPGDAPSS